MPTITPQQFVLVAAAMTASATLTAALITWIKDRNATARRIQALDEATKYVAFWQTIKKERDLSATTEEKLTLARAFAGRIAIAEAMVETRGSVVKKRTSRREEIKAFLADAGKSMFGAIVLFGLTGLSMALVDMYFHDFLMMHTWVSKGLYGIWGVSTMLLLLVIIGLFFNAALGVFAILTRTTLPTIEPWPEFRAATDSGDKDAQA